jgi:predicted amidohydrolase YtcJ
MNVLAGRRSGDVRFPLPEAYLSDMLRIDGVKFFADGGITSATAAISIPYRETGTSGVLIWEDEDLARLHVGGPQRRVAHRHARQWRRGDRAGGEDLRVARAAPAGDAPPDRAPGAAHA